MKQLTKEEKEALQEAITTFCGLGEETVNEYGDLLDSVMNKINGVRPILKIKREKFANWYFDDDQTKQTGRDCWDTLIKVNEFKVTLQGLYEQTGYIPLNLIINKNEVLEEDINNGEIEEPSSIYKVEWV